MTRPGTTATPTTHAGPSALPGVRPRSNQSVEGTPTLRVAQPVALGAGIVKVPKPARCGCCDGPSPVAICSRCDEPTCAEHFVRLTDETGERRYVCTICAEIELTARNLVADTFVEAVA